MDSDRLGAQDNQVDGKPGKGEASIEGLRQALIRLAQPRFNELEIDIREVRQKLEELSNLTANLPDDLKIVDSTIEELIQKSQKAEDQIQNLTGILSDASEIAERLKPALANTLSEGVREKPDAYAEAIAPIISPAIRSQIRDSRQEFVAALAPVIGESIRKSIADAFVELRRVIDARLNREWNLQYRFRSWLARLKGVPETDLILRQALPYQVLTVFLIHRQTGLLLEQVSASNVDPDSDLISAMLTAIRDFTRDAFGAGEDELDEIQSGNSRILIDSGEFAYMAVVVAGIEPIGFRERIKSTLHKINFEYGSELQNYDGQMTNLPDYKSVMSSLLVSTSQEIEVYREKQNLSRGQKLAISLGMGVTLLAIALGVFACVMSIRLYPVAFPGPTYTMTYTITPSVTPTQTRATPTLRPTATTTPTPTATASLTPSPTITFTPTPALAYIANSNGQGVYLRAAPGGRLISGALPEGAVVSLIQRFVAPDGRVWYEVRDLAGRTGWVQALYLEMRP